MFQVLYQSSQKGWSPVPDALFDCPQKAQMFGRDRSKRYGMAHRIERIKTDVFKGSGWMVRELRRFLSGEYKPLPFPASVMLELNKRRPLHFPHLSTSCPGMIAYTRSIEHGRDDRQTRVRAGRYFSQFHGDLFDGPAIAALSTMCGESDFEIIRDSKQIANAYMNGPHSCMAYSTSDYDTGRTHPTEVYGNESDITLAVLYRDGDINARALIWESKKIYGEIYGDTFKMEQALEGRGFSYGCFTGAKLRLLETDDGHIICPYLDNEQGIDVFRSHLLIGGSEHIASQTNGRLDELAYCVHCGDSIARGDEHRDYNAEPYHFDCYLSVYTNCDSCGEEVCHDDTYTTADCTSICIRCYGSEYASCDSCDEIYHADELTVTDEHVTCERCKEESS